MALSMPRTIRRTKAEAGTSTGSGRMDDLRLEWHLRNWKGWMNGGRVTIGFKKETPGMYSGGSAHFDDMVGASDRRSARACDASINDLPPAQSSAIYSEYLHAVYRFPRDNLAELLAQGKEGVRASLEGKGIW